MRTSRWLAAAGLVVLSNVALAQGTDSARPLRPLRGRGAALPGGRVGRAAQAPGRPALEAAVQQAMAKAVRRQLNLDDQKMRQLQRTNAKFDVERRGLVRDEREARQTLKAALEDSTTTDQSKIEQSMTRMIQIQKRRAELLEAEQKDLAVFLTPRQRAQFFSLRERITRRMLEMQGAPPDGGPRGGRPVPPI